MNTNLFDQFIRAARLIKPPASEKGKILREVLVFMRKHPSAGLKEEKGFYHQIIFLIRIISSARFFYSLRLKPVRIIVPLFALVFLTGGITVFAAEFSLPGDLLYPVKIKAAEPLMSVLAFSDEAKAELSVKFTERRLEEAEELAASGKLNTATQYQVVAGLKDNTSRFNELLTKFEKEGDTDTVAEISSELESSLKAHGSVLYQIGESREDSKVMLTSIILQIKANSDEVSEARFKNEAKIISQSDIEVEITVNNKINTAEGIIRDARISIERNKTKIGPEAKARVEKNLKLAEQKIVEGRVELESKAYSSALSKFQESIRVAKESLLLIKAKTDLDLDIKTSDPSDSGIDLENKGEEKESSSSILEIRGESNLESKDSIKIKEHFNSEVNTENNLQLEIKSWLNISGKD